VIAIAFVAGVVVGVAAIAWFHRDEWWD